MTVAIIVPFAASSCDWRTRARAHVGAWYAHHFGDIELVDGTSPDPWSKGAAVADAIAKTDADILVLADADSFMYLAEPIRTAIDLVRSGARPYVTPHRNVYRLRDEETARLLDAGTAWPRPRLGWTVRPMYQGPIGGGITVVSRSAYELVRGIDPRFLGWGGEDIVFGWALDTLAGEGARLEGDLVHLWHPHPAPDLRGSPESEELVARYREARGIPRRMTAVISGEPWAPLPPLDTPVTFRMTANRNSVRLPSGTSVRFAHGIYTTADPDEVEQLRRYGIIRELAPRG